VPDAVEAASISHGGVADEVHRMGPGQDLGDGLDPAGKAGERIVRAAQEERGDADGGMTGP
jgi:hypothetical protein